MHEQTVLANEAALDLRLEKTTLTGVEVAAPRFFLAATSVLTVTIEVRVVVVVSDSVLVDVATVVDDVIVATVVVKVAVPTVVNTVVVATVLGFVMVAIVEVDVTA